MPATTELHGLARAAAAIKIPWTGPYADSLKANEKPLSGIARAAAAFAADDAKASGESRGIGRAAAAIKVPAASAAPAANHSPPALPVTAHAAPPAQPLPVAEVRWNPAIRAEMDSLTATGAKRFDDPIFRVAFQFARTRSMAREGTGNAKLNGFMDGITAGGIVNKVNHELKVRGLSWTEEAFAKFEAGLFALSKAAGSVNDIEDAHSLVMKMITED